MRTLSRLGDGIWYLILAGIVIGFGYTGWQEVSAVVPIIPARITLTGVAPIAGIVGLLALIVFAETLYPLRALSRERWVYVDRPRGKLRGTDWITWTQLIGFGVLGLGICVSTGLSPWFALTVPALRFVVGWRSFTLASLLSAGHTRLVGGSGLGLLDSEVTSDAIASQSAWIPRRTHAPSTLTGLFFRRLGRRWYIGVGALAALGLTLGFAPQLGALAIVGFMSAWSIVGAAVGRAASFGRVSDDAWPDWGLPLIASVGTALLGAGVLLLVWKLSAIAVVLIIAGLSWASFKRSRPAQVDSMSMLDSGGFGVSFSPEVLHYIARGALGLGVAALALGY
ncbi:MULTISPECIES: ABC transporter permease [Corynebacterium]|uniref:ABC transporter permease n=1 Tax=Corynebacterium TaxID=1716 RepID=UPI0008A2FE17|nr:MULTISPECIES: ABC transporter permease [Corynebacterium]MCG7260515.1 ABC transporter permease [Corynebacterium aurimucosum]MCZ9299113.1 ABC transporter permease [Corynebacterium hesseae]OFK92525.1 ABC transporter permease [Corynebacterium sp. HMSC068H04]